MDIKILTQPELCNGKSYTLGDELNSLLLSKRPKFTEVSFFFGLVKDVTFENFSGSIKEYIMNGGDFKFYLSQSQKNTLKKVANSLLELGCEVYLFNNSGNNSISDFQYKGAIFENAKKATVILSTGNFTESGLFNGYNTITKLSYDLSDEQDEFTNLKNSIISENVLKSFTRVTRENFEAFFTKEIPTIEEFTRKDVDQTEPIITSIDDINIDIEIDDKVDFSVAEVEEEKPKKEPKPAITQEKEIISQPAEVVEFESTKYFMDDDALDIENMLFNESSRKTANTLADDVADNSLEEDKPEENPKIITKTKDLSKTSIFMLQIPKITKKGTASGELKIPLYLRDLIPAFWGWPKGYSVQKNSNEKSRICTFKIIDTANADNVITDDNVKLFQREGENSFSIFSENLIELDLHENDIIRFIKTEAATGSYFTCEIIRTDANEYPIWEQFCTNLLKGSKRKYGMM